jgi:hypothetical protein
MKDIFNCSMREFAKNIEKCSITLEFIIKMSHTVVIKNHQRRWAIMATKKTAPKKKVAAKKTVARKPKSVAQQSFKVAPEKYPFITFKITDQTVYWSILLILILLLGIWVINIQISISEILSNFKY